MFHQSAPSLFAVRHGETRTPEECMVTVKGWNDAHAAEDEPDAVVLDIRTDCWGESWLTAEQARLLASHLLGAAHALDPATVAPEVVEVHPTSTPAADLPLAMVHDVARMLRAHGLDPDLLALSSALYDVITATAVAKGGTAQ